MKKKKLILFDGHAIIHRAFHAIPNLTSPKGEPVNGVYGFFMIFLNALKEIKPTHIAVALDVGGKTIRHKEYEEYKAHRKAAPEGLNEQTPKIKEILRAFNVPIYEKKGYEADDIIGTLAKQAARIKDLETIIVTGDLDTLQLVKPNVLVYTMRRGLTDTVIYDEKLVKQRFGFSPENLVDFKGLRGDPSDNIPGVAGIGEKTATDLIKKYKSISNIYKNVNQDKDLSERYKDLLKKQEKEAKLSKKLAKIICDLPVKLELNKSELHDFDRTKVLKQFQELGFKSLISKIPTPLDEVKKQDSLFVQEKATKKRKENYQICQEIKEINSLIQKIKKKGEVVFDVETDELGGKLIGVSFALKEKEAYYLCLKHRKSQIPNPKSQKMMKILKPILEDPKIKKIGHNLKYDYLILKKSGIKLKGIYFDTMFAAYVLNPGKRNYNLDGLAFVDLGIEMIPIKELIGKGANEKKLDEVPLEKVADYSCEDADMTYRLYKLYDNKLKGKLKSVFQKIEMPLLVVLAEMEYQGIKIDENKLKDLSKKFHTKIKNLKKRIYQLAGCHFNINSTQQLREVLFEKLKIETSDVRKTKTGLSTAAAELDKLRGRHRIIDLISEYRELTKLKNTYIDALPKLTADDGRIHTSFNQTITATGRLSSSNPNLQNIPIRTELGNKIRSTFVARKGYKLLSFDYSQIELRIVAHMSQDKKMISAFRKKEDIHAATAAWVFNKPISKVTSKERREAKTVNFGVLYGMSAFGLSQGLKIPRDEAKKFIDDYYETFNGVKNYLDETKEFAREKGYVETIFGRRRYLPEINSNMFDIVAAAERMAINMPVQGTAADIIKLAMIEIAKKNLSNRLDLKLLLQVHDELLFECSAEKNDKYITEIRKIMGNVYKLDVPLIVDVSIGNNWASLKKYR